MLGPASRPTDHAGLAVLSFAECLDLIAGQPVGRIAFARDGDIDVLPVNHCVVDQKVAFRTAGGAKFTAAFWGSVVAFEVDSYDAAGGAGGACWSRDARSGSPTRRCWPGSSEPAFGPGPRPRREPSGSSSVPTRSRDDDCEAAGGTAARRR